MKVISNLIEDTTDGISTTLNLEKFQDNSVSDILFYGINCTQNNIIKEFYKNYNRRVLLNLWNPCEFTVPDNSAGDAYQQADYFTESYQICPWTTKWMNEQQNTNKYKFIWHPFDYTYQPKQTNKIYDCVYFGGLHGPQHYECIDKIKKFNYRFLSQQHYPEVTNFNVSYKEKLNIISQCKINIVYNFIPLRDDLKTNIKKYNNWQQNKAFEHIDTLNIISQLKARLHESALCRTLNLVMRDPWNIIEYFYIPNEDFYYFNNNNELPYLINNILKTWDSHQHIIESAYNKCFNYGAKETYNFIKERKDLAAEVSIH